MYYSKFASLKQYLFDHPFSRIAKKVDIDQIRLQFCYFTRIETIHKTSKISAEKSLSP